MKPTSGFTLIEMAIVLLIVTLLLGGLLMPLSAQVEQRKVSETQKTLEEIKEALLGFAIANGRLPCPANAISHGAEAPAGGGACANALDGFVPAVTLGITPTDDQGFAIDGWGQRIRYAVTTANSRAATSTDGIKIASMGTFSPDLHVCASSAGVTATACGPPTNTLMASAPALIYSLGKNWATGGGTGNDEAENLDADQVFVSHVPSPATAPNGEFDDIVTWLSPNILFSRMLAAGRLP
jgi:prepilin-type N-terminal cleavage/methylation domain-containing protein